MSLTNYAESALLNSLFGKTSSFGALASVPTLYIGLSTSDPGESGGITGEPSATGGYARITTSAANWDASTGGSAIDNGAVLSFPESSAAWSTGATALTHFFITDSVTLGAGNVIASAALTTSRTVNAAGITLSFAAGAITAALD